MSSLSWLRNILCYCSPDDDDDTTSLITTRLEFCSNTSSTLLRTPPSLSHSVSTLSSGSDGPLNPPSTEEMEWFTPLTRQVPRREQPVFGRRRRDTHRGRRRCRRVHLARRHCHRDQTGRHWRRFRLWIWTGRIEGCEGLRTALPPSSTLGRFSKTFTHECSQVSKCTTSVARCLQGARRGIENDTVYMSLERFAEVLIYTSISKSVAKTSRLHF
jgi:hypothetical protein